ncbi:MAG TPA: adenylate kinase [Acidimicrobiia bacterium]|nr:adenylate kinase [Acidimicrobiia bacterium]
MLFIGPPGAGKGTQADLVSERLGIPHVSTGDMFRHHVGEGTEIGKRVKAILDSGDYVPDSITVEMLEDRMADEDARRGFILDGFPRTLPQVEALDELIGRDGLDRVVVFDVNEDELTERILARGRSDDTEEAVRNRFKIYQEQTAPLIDLYRSRGVVVEIDGMGEVEEVTDRILSALADEGGNQGF